MVYFKSVVAGIASLILAALIGYLLLISYLSLSARAYPWAFSFGFESSHAPRKITPLDIALTVVPLLIFAAGFAWEYRRASGNSSGKLLP